MRIRFAILLLALASVGLAAPAPTAFRLEFRDGLLWVQVTLPPASAPLRFLLDSGAGVSVIDLTTARRLGIPLYQPATVQGVAFQTTGYWSPRLTAKVGGIVLRRPWLAVDLAALGQDGAGPVDGLLGVDFFRHRVVQIDYRAQTVRLLPCARPGPASAVVPLRFCDGALQVRLRVNDSRPEWGRLDTGCASALQWLARGPQPPGLSPRVAIGLVQVPIFSGPASVQLGPWRFDQVAAGLHQHPLFPGEAGLLGNGLLARFRVTIDAPGRRLILDPPDPPQKPGEGFRRAQRNRSGTGPTHRRGWAPARTRKANT